MSSSITEMSCASDKVEVNPECGLIIARRRSRRRWSWVSRFSLDPIYPKKCLKRFFVHLSSTEKLFSSGLCDLIKFSRSKKTLRRGEISCRRVSRRRGFGVDTVKWYCNFRVIYSKTFVAAKAAKGRSLLAESKVLMLIERSSKL